MTNLNEEILVEETVENKTVEVESTEDEIENMPTEEAVVENNYENFKLKDGTVLEVEQFLSGSDLHLIVPEKTLAEAEALFSKDNISRVALEDENGEYAIFNNYNASIITKNSETDSVEVVLFAKVPDRIQELENQIVDTQLALAEVYEAQIAMISE